MEAVTRRGAQRKQKTECRRASHRPRSRDRARDGIGLGRRTQESCDLSASRRCHPPANRNHSPRLTSGQRVAARNGNRPSSSSARPCSSASLEANAFSPHHAPKGYSCRTPPIRVSILKLLPLPQRKRDRFPRSRRTARHGCNPSRQSTRVPGGGPQYHARSTEQSRWLPPSPNG